MRSASWLHTVVNMLTGLGGGAAPYIRKLARPSYSVIELMGWLWFGYTIGWQHGHWLWTGIAAIVVAFTVSYVVHAPSIRARHGKDDPPAEPAK